MAGKKKHVGWKGSKGDSERGGGRGVIPQDVAN